MTITSVETTQTLTVAQVQRQLTQTSSKKQRQQHVNVSKVYKLLQYLNDNLKNIYSCYNTSYNNHYPTYLPILRQHILLLQYLRQLK